MSPPLSASAAENVHLMSWKNVCIVAVDKPDASEDVELGEVAPVYLQRVELEVRRRELSPLEVGACARKEEAARRGRGEAVGKRDHKNRAPEGMHKIEASPLRDSPPRLVLANYFVCLANLAVDARYCCMKNLR
jgi:hypothetical protein